MFGTRKGNFDPILNSIDDHLDWSSDLEIKHEKDIEKLNELLDAKDERIARYLTQAFIDEITNQDNEESLATLSAVFVMYYFENSTSDDLQKIVSDNDLIEHLGL